MKMKFEQLLEYNRNIFLEKSYIKFDGETNPRPFSGKLKLSIDVDQYSKVLCGLFWLHPKFRAIKIYWN